MARISWHAMTTLAFGIRARLLALIIIGVLPLAAFHILSLREAREERIANAQSRALDHARSGADLYRDAVTDARTVLEIIAQMPLISFETSSRCRSFLDAIDRKRATTTGISIINADMRVVCTTVPYGAGFDVSTRPWLRADVAKSGFHVSDFFLTSVGKTPASMAVLPVPGLRDDDLRIFTASLSIAWMQRLADEIGTDAKATIALVAGDGTLLARYPAMEDLIGRQVVDSALVGRALLEGEGSAEFVDQSGTPRLFSYVRLPDSQALLIVGFDRAHVVAPIERGFRNALYVLIAVGICVLAAVFFAGRVWFIHPIVRLQAAATAFGSGDLSARAIVEADDAVEFRKLAVAFDAMARAIEFRDAQVRAANDKLLRQEADLQAANRRLEILAHADGLTGLANRRRFDLYLDECWQQAAADRTGLALVLIDIDHFKLFNDNYGHPAGDRCLREVAQAIQTAALRPDDLAARCGGEEFAILLPRLPRDHLDVVVELVRVGVLERAIQRDDTPAGCVTVSVGAAYLYPEPNVSAEMLRSAADKALYGAKRKGRNRTLVDADPQPRDWGDPRLVATLAV